VKQATPVLKRFAGAGSRWPMRTSGPDVPPLYGHLQLSRFSGFLHSLKWIPFGTISALRARHLIGQNICRLQRRDIIDIRNSLGTYATRCLAVVVEPDDFLDLRFRKVPLPRKYKVDWLSVAIPHLVNRMRDCELWAKVGDGMKG